MKKIAIIALAFVLVCCSSHKRYNAHLNDLIDPQDLRADVDFIHHKLEQLHPNLYWYISQQALNHKFDSVKKTITHPMTSTDFHHKISPVISAVRQGHMYVHPPQKMFSRKQTDSIKKKGFGPLSQFEFENFDGKIYVTKNKSTYKSVAIGSELLAVNGISPSELLNEYSNYFASDGFNTTFKKRITATRLSTFYSYRLGICDSLKFDLKLGNAIQSVTVKRGVDSTGIAKPNAKKPTKTDKAVAKAQRKALRKKKDEQGYDDFNKVYNRNLRFMEADSSIAVMKINGFSKGSFYRFYEESFQKIKQNQSKTLILDLRNNGGGRLSEIIDLYSYLAETPTPFIDDSQVVSKTSLLRTNFLKSETAEMTAIKVFLSPFWYGYNFFKVYKNNEGKYVYSKDTKPVKIKPDAFKGKIYVLINGGSFSASCILSSNLKGSGRAYFVGEETGGTYNGTVAGILPEVILPHSKIRVRVGMVFIAPHYKTELQGRGIFPDKEIIPTLQDRTSGIDPEIQWVLENLKQKAVVADTTKN